MIPIRVFNYLMSYFQHKLMIVIKNICQMIHNNISINFQTKHYNLN